MWRLLVVEKTRRHFLLAFKIASNFIANCRSRIRNRVLSTVLLVFVVVSLGSPCRSFSGLYHASLRKPHQPTLQSSLASTDRAPIFAQTRVRAPSATTTSIARKRRLGIDLHELFGSRTNKDVRSDFGELRSDVRVGSDFFDSWSSERVLLQHACEEVPEFCEQERAISRVRSFPRPTNKRSKPTLVPFNNLPSTRPNQLSPPPELGLPVRSKSQHKKNHAHRPDIVELAVKVALKRFGRAKHGGTREPTDGSVTKAFHGGEIGDFDGVVGIDEQVLGLESKSKIAMGFRTAEARNLSNRSFSPRTHLEISMSNLAHPVQKQNNLDNLSKQLVGQLARQPSMGSQTGIHVHSIHPSVRRTRARRKRHMRVV